MQRLSLGQESQGLLIRAQDASEMTAEHTHALAGADVPEVHHPVSPFAGRCQAFPVRAKDYAACPIRSAWTPRSARASELVQTHPVSGWRERPVGGEPREAPLQ
jgi:hypothetical protein